MRPTNPVACAALVALALCGWLCAPARPASAAEVRHALEGSFDGGAFPGSPMRSIVGLETDRSGGPGDGDVYVAEVTDSSDEAFPSRVLEFHRDGTYAGVALDGAATPDGSFSFLAREPVLQIATDGLAVDDSTGPNNGDVYVPDTAHGVLDRFGQDGGYECQITGRAMPSTSECDGLTGSATPGGGFTPDGVAVDETTGDVYVTDAGRDAILVFAPSGAFLETIASPQLDEPTTIALAPGGGAIYVLNGGESLFTKHNVLKLSPTGAVIGELGQPNTTGLAVDPVTGHVYLLEMKTFEEQELSDYEPDGTLVASVPLPRDLYFGLAVDQRSGRIYAGTFGTQSSGNAHVDVIGPIAVVPDVEAEGATDVTETTVTVNGSVAPDPAGGEVVECRVEYGTTTSYGHSVPCAPAPPSAAPTSVSAQITGLQPSTTYHFRIAAKNPPAPPYSEAVPGVSEDVVAATTGAPTVDAESAAEIDRTSARLRAEIDPHGYPAEFAFEFVPDSAYEEDGFAGPATRVTEFSGFGSGLTPVAVEQSVAGLDVGTTYHFRAVAVNPKGRAYGAEQTFTTLPVARVEDAWARARLTGASLEARVEPIGLPTDCRVEYVDAGAFAASGYATASSAPCDRTLPAEAESEIGRAAVSGLELNAEYHFRFVLTNASGTLVGPDRSFKTFGLESFRMELLDEHGDPYTQAGGHPWEKILSYRFNHTELPQGRVNLNAFVKDILTEQPPGLTGVREEAIPKCEPRLAESDRCPVDSQVGKMEVEYAEDGGISTTTKDLYDVVPPEGVAVRYASTSPYTVSDSSVRTGDDYGVTSNGRDLTEEGRVVGLTVTLWGVPAEHIAGGTTEPILRAPTACEGPLTARVKADAWQGPGLFAEASTELPAITGCDKLEFHPELEWKPTSRTADSPTGLHLDIHQDQNTEVDHLSYADLKDVLMHPPKGLVFNPAGANGLVGCPQADFGFHQDSPARCPDASKIGRVEIDTPLVDHPLVGGIFMAVPHENPFDSMFAIYLAVGDAPTGVVVKLAGQIDADGKDGHLTATFDENPQLPVEDFKLDFFDGPQAVLRSPPACGTYVTTASLSPWSAPQSGPPVERSDTFRIDSAPSRGGCVGSEAQMPNTPSFEAGSRSPRAGAYSPYVIRLHREDGTQQFAGLSIQPPSGLLAKLAGVARCPDAAIDAARRRSGREERADWSCGEESAVGTVEVAAGAGPAPYDLGGRLFLAGPYHGAPLSLAAIVPAVAGPFDLGNVVVRTPLQVDLESAALQVRTDPIPTILEGISLDVRTVTVRLDRPGFAVNPTSCKAASTTASTASPSGSLASVGAPFRLRGCRALGFEPSMRLRLTGSSARRGHPGLRATLRMPPHSSNIASVAVTMPPTEFFDNTHIAGVCTREEFLREACPADSVYGYATTWSPLIDEPLHGPVYMRSSRRGLPQLVADLRGEFRLALGGRISSGGGGIGANVSDLADIPVTKFSMRLFGGKRGLLQNSVDDCRHRLDAVVRLIGQNGKVAVLHPRLRVACRGGRGEPRRG